MPPGDPCDDYNACTLDPCDENADQCLPKECDESILDSAMHPCCSDPVCHASTICSYCEGNFDGDLDVDADDVTEFLNHFGRGKYFRPCTNPDLCSGDFICDGDVDASDITVFLHDFGRGQYFNSCPTGLREPWCVYP